MRYYGEILHDFNELNALLASTSNAALLFQSLYIELSG